MGQNVAQKLIGSHLAAVLLQAVLGVGFAVLLAVISHESFEKRFLLLKRWFGGEAADATRREATVAQGPARPPTELMGCCPGTKSA